MTAAPGRLMEGVMADRLLEDLEERGWLADEQGGFRRGRGTADTLALLTDRTHQVI